MLLQVFEPILVVSEEEPKYDGGLLPHLATETVFQNQGMIQQSVEEINKI